MKSIKATLLSMGIMTAVSGILLAAATFVIDKMGVLPKAALPIITTVIGCAAVFLGAFFSSFYGKERGLLLGIVSGGVFLLVVLIGASFTLQAEFTLGSLGKAAAVLLSGAIGGIAGVNRKGRVKF